MAQPVGGFRVATRPPSPEDEEVDEVEVEVEVDLVGSLVETSLGAAVRMAGRSSLWLRSDAGGLRVAVRPPSPDDLPLLSPLLSVPREDVELPLELDPLGL